VRLTPYPKGIHVGDVPAKVVYAGDTQLWPIWTPADIPGLAAWIDPASDLTITYGPDRHVVAYDANAGSNSGFDSTLGMRFTPVAAGRITQLGTWIGPGTHVFSLWDTATGTKLASVTGTYGGVADWHYETLPTPVDVEARHSYTVSYSTDNAPYGYVISWTPPNSSFTGRTACGVLGRDVFPGGPENPYGISTEHFHADVVYQQKQPGFTDGQVITSYTSHDPGGRVFTAFAGAGPIYRATSVGGKPRIEFDAGRTDALIASGYNPGTTGLTFVMVKRSAVIYSYDMMLTWHTPVNGYEMRHPQSFAVQCVGDYAMGGSALVSDWVGTPNVDYVNMMVVDAASATKTLKLYINDTLQFSPAAVAMPNVPSPLRIGIRADGYHLNGLVAEALVISGPISDADRAKLMTYLRAKHAQSFQTVT
jgi:hypothetical protein